MPTAALREKEQRCAAIDVRVMMGEPVSSRVHSERTRPSSASMSGVDWKKTT
jgi:hypothetical protein